MSTQVIELAEMIKEKGQVSAGELPELLEKAEALAHDHSQDVLTRALAHRAAGNARQLLNQFQPALESYNTAAELLETLGEPVELGRTLHAKVGMLFTLSRFTELFECSARARNSLSNVRIRSAWQDLTSTCRMPITDWGDRKSRWNVLNGP